MSLNIKNEETCRLARELANLSGESITGAVTVALAQRLDREKHASNAPERLQDMLNIAKRCSDLLGPGLSSVEHAKILFDDDGLPR